jgi:1-phosphatidylinositol-4-phosphate 5-kinase
VKGKVIDGQHELYTLSIAVMLGLRTSIKNTNKLLSAGDLDVGGKRRWLDSDDFMSVEKYVFRPSVSERNTICLCVCLFLRTC